MYDEEFRRIVALIAELQGFARATHARGDAIISRLNDDRTETHKAVVQIVDKMNESAMGNQKTVDQIANHLQHVYKACTAMSRRIDTLEILASKKFAEEIEGPMLKTETSGNA